MDSWSLDLKSEFVNNLYESYLNRVEHITTLYSVVTLIEQQICSSSECLNEAVEIPLSTNFGNWATIKRKRDIMHSVKSGQLHRINCYQAVVSLVSNFEDLIDRIINHVRVSKKEISNAAPIGQKGRIDHPLLKKVHAVHSNLSMHSNMVGRHETYYYYRIIKARNCIVHRQGIPNSLETTLLQGWVSDGCIAFDKNQIDDFVHFFLMPLISMIKQLDQQLGEDIEESNS
ncbi:hypothetical protein DFR31_1984 [Alkalispirillum mobile]|uniref:MAE-28990/MAE-18760-like HEPN domain-containing protein n=1 Tax=Alkalispirillum mobile TaxID=85925 RepID=A0A498C146_9GAMM|nr:hypothetical protein [Alkalispirillum mobile]RLK48869.1 hypothetical protein DFR31_1984 [Alkalispirillum mobile]